MIDTFEAMAALERRCAAMQPQPLFKLEPGAAKGEGGAPAAFPMLKAIDVDGPRSVALLDRP